MTVVVFYFENADDNDCWRFEEDSPSRFRKHIVDTGSSSEDEEEEIKIVCAESPKQVVKNCMISQSVETKPSRPSPLGIAAEFATPSSSTSIMMRNCASLNLNKSSTTPRFSRKRKSVPASSIKQLFHSPSKARKRKISDDNYKISFVHSPLPLCSPLSRVRSQDSDENTDGVIGEFMSPSKIQRIYDFELNANNGTPTPPSSGSSNGGILSQTITQISSSTCDEDFSSTLEGNTPISDWLLKSKSCVLEKSMGEASHAIEITQFDSPQKESMKLCEVRAIAKRLVALS